MLDATDRELSSALHGLGLRATPQRLVLRRLIEERGDQHVTPEELFDQARTRLPGLSRPTAYATLELFADLGIVRRLSIGEGRIAYDTRTDDHHHAVCTACGAVLDLDVALDLEPLRAAAEAAGFQLRHAHAVADGVCRRCREAAPAS